MARYVRSLLRWPRPRGDEIVVVTAGGLGRIGMNWTFYGHRGGWIAVDAGIAFPDDRDNGVDAITLDPRCLKDMLDGLDALIVTHAHEDHIGGIDRLWPNAINCPIYATPFALALISRRLDEAGTRDSVDLREFKVGSSFDIAAFHIHSIAVTHSVPEPVALAITTTAGTVVHTGDFKIDAQPLLGQPADLETFRLIGNKGVLAVIGDSTNAEKNLKETSESGVLEAYRRLFKSRRGAVVVCCFASNVARVSSALIAASESGRMSALAGRSMRTNHGIACELGMLATVPEPLVEPVHLLGLDNREVALICTGTQGEERAALGRLARGDWRLPSLGTGDTVVMSARAIPGNEKAIEAVLSKLRARGVEVLDGKSLIDGYPLHVSGHAGQAELRYLYSLLKPRYSIPVHGTNDSILAHSRIALECGVEVAHVGGPGHALALSNAGLKLLGKINVVDLDLENDDKGNRIPVSMERLQKPVTGMRDVSMTA